MACAAIPNALVICFCKSSNLSALFYHPFTKGFIIQYNKMSECIVDTFFFIVLQKGITPYKLSLPQFSLSI